MAQIKVHKSVNFTTVSTHHLRNKGLSLKAKGLLTLILSLPVDWDYSVIGLTSLSKDGKDAVMSALAELSEAGYICIESFRNDKGQYESVYNVFEEPNRDSRCGKSESENPIQFNTNNIDINVQSKDCTTLFDNKPNIIKEENISSIPPIIPHEEKRKGANLDTSFVEDEYKDAYMQWLEYKRAIKKPYKTQQSLELNYRQAKSLAGNDPQTFRLIIEQSIGNGWTGLFELKTNYHESTTVNSPSNGLNEPERRKRNYDFAF